MYRYDHHDHRMLADRVRQFREQTRRYLRGDLSDAEFLPLRLQNGVYIQRLAPMLRIAVPYGMLSSRQLRHLAFIVRRYDKGYGHFTTRQNIQFNWPALEDVPDILAGLAEVEMHAIQTSGNCIRNITTDQFAGVARQEVEDTRPYCEIIRQWSTFHPEFAYLPRKFKIAVCGTEADQAATQVHDIGVYMIRRGSGTISEQSPPTGSAAGCALASPAPPQGGSDLDDIGFRILAGGGLGRTPVIGQEIFPFVPKADLLTALEAIMRVYNREGRRDNKYKARIKILVRESGIEAFREKVFAEWARLKDTALKLTDEEVTRCRGFFTDPEYKVLEDDPPPLREALQRDALFAAWYENNTAPHKRPGYAIASVTLKQTGVPPGDVTDQQMELLADLADEFSFGELRISHRQNIVLADVEQARLPVLWQRLKSGALHSYNLNRLTDVICCPGGDFCALADAKSIPVAEAVQRQFSNAAGLDDLGEISVNISGCMNACGHHHVGNIGILGVDKKGEEFYQISLGGSSRRDASLGAIMGPAFAREEVPAVVERLAHTYKAQRREGEAFLDTYRRIGMAPFKAAVYQGGDEEGGNVSAD